MQFSSGKRFSVAADPFGLEDPAADMGEFVRIVSESIYADHGKPTLQVVQNCFIPGRPKPRAFYQIDFNSENPHIKSVTPENLFLALRRQNNYKCTPVRYVEVLECNVKPFSKITKEEWAASRQYGLRTDTLLQGNMHQIATVFRFRDLGIMPFPPNEPVRSLNAHERHGHFVHVILAEEWNGDEMLGRHSWFHPGNPVLYVFNDDNAGALVTQYSYEALHFMRSRQAELEASSPLYMGIIKAAHIGPISCESPEWKCMTLPARTAFSTGTVDPKQDHVLLNIHRADARVFFHPTGRMCFQ